MRQRILRVGALAFFSFVALGWTQTEKEKPFGTTTHQGVEILASNLEGTPSTITGLFEYSTPEVLADLGLEDWITEEQRVVYAVSVEPGEPTAVCECKKPRKCECLGEDHDLLMPKLEDLASILSLGEGVSGFVPHLVGRGIDAKGLDLFYAPEGPNFVPTNNENAHEAILANWYVNKFRDALLFGDATNMKNPPSDRYARVGEASYAMVVSHDVFNHLTPDDRVKMASEAFRVVKQGGIMVFNRAQGLTGEENQKFLARMINALAGIAPLQYTIERRTVTIDLTPETRETIRSTLASFQASGAIDMRRDFAPLFERVMPELATEDLNVAQLKGLVPMFLRVFAPQELMKMTGQKGLQALYP